MKHSKCEKTTQKRFLKWKDRVLIMITSIAFAALIISISCLRVEDSIIPVIVMLVSILWLALFMLANGGDHRGS